MGEGEFEFACSSPNFGLISPNPISNDTFLARRCGWRHFHIKSNSSRKSKAKVYSLHSQSLRWRLKILQTHFNHVSRQRVIINGFCDGSHRLGSVQKQNTLCKRRRRGCEKKQSRCLTPRWPNEKIITLSSTHANTFQSFSAHARASSFQQQNIHHTCAPNFLSSRKYAEILYALIDQRKLTCWVTN